MVKNAFYFPLKALFALKMFRFLSRIFVQGEKRLDEKEKVNSKLHDVKI